MYSKPIRDAIKIAKFLRSEAQAIDYRAPRHTYNDGRHASNHLNYLEYSGPRSFAQSLPSAIRESAGWYKISDEVCSGIFEKYGVNIGEFDRFTSPACLKTFFDKDGGTDYLLNKAEELIAKCGERVERVKLERATPPAQTQARKVVKL